MRLLTKNILSVTRVFFTAAQLIVLMFFILTANLQAQDGEIYILTADALQDGKTAADLTKAGWKYQAGDDAAWANPQFDDSAWDKLEETTIKPDALPKSGWNGRAWFRLRFKIDEAVKDKDFALIVWQWGASEIYLDGKLLAEFGGIRETDEFEFNPNRLPVPFRFDSAGEHVLAVRYSASVFADMSRGKARWLTSGGVYPTFTSAIRSTDDIAETILSYANSSSMRIGFLFVGIMLALALLHFLLYLFYRVERANLFYSIYVFSFAVSVLCGNLRFSGHQGAMPSTILRLISFAALAATFVALIAFLRVAFGQNLGRVFWVLSGIWAIMIFISWIYIGNTGIFKRLPNILIFLSFLYSIFLVAKALREKQRDAWILLTGVQIYAIGMFSTLVNQYSLLDLPFWAFLLGEFSLILGVPVAVSVFLARNFAQINRHLAAQLEQVEHLSQQKIEQERQSAELRVENERRAKELEEARQLQLSMLPKKLPSISNIEIAAYMKPATEVGGDYYDFHVGTDGTLTVAVGDATGHGLKAGTMVTAAKSLFNNLASEPDISSIFRQSSAALKKMNLRGMFMAMTMLKLKNDKVSLICAGMPSVLIYRSEAKKIEEISIRASPLGGISNFVYQQINLKISADDIVVLMSDGFPEMFNEQDEIFGYDKAEIVLLENTHLPAQEIINRFVEAAEQWAGGRPQDDDVTFVVLKIKSGGGAVENGNNH